MLSIGDFDNKYTLPQRFFSASHSDFKDWVNNLFSSAEIQRPRVIPTENLYEHTSEGSVNDELSDEESLAVAANTVFAAPKAVDVSKELEELLRGGVLESFSA